MSSAYTALTAAGYRAQVRDKATLFFTFAFPLLFLVVFGLIFSGQEVAETGRPYISYIAPGVMSWGVANAAVFGIAFTLMQWRRDDLLRLIRLTPTPLTTVLASRYGLALVVGLAQAVVFIAVAMLPGFGLSLDGRWPLAVPVLLLGITAFLAIGVIVGTYANTPEAVAAIANCLMVPMAFLSGSFLPLDLMPTWLRTVSLALPLRYLNDAVTGTLAGTGSLGDIAVDCVVLLGFAAVFGALALKAFRWSNRT
ncbi:ABC transporter permease [Streptomyces sp. NPDC006879]|uniref:ABC transporter permease n=1 Tax=Streptomyces sp. NPDC006879 TaxID=3364767 RepID=UPI0036B0DBDC